jgi:hypothetical protein
MTTTIDSAAGANYDVEIDATSINAANDASWFPTKDSVLLFPGDNIVVGVTAATDTGTVYVSIILEEDTT